MLTAAIVLAFVSTAWAQNAPQIGYVYPTGGRQGTTFQVKVGGQFLRGLTNAYLSGAVGKATFVEYNRPLAQKEFNILKDEFRQLQEKQRSAQVGRGTNGWTTADESRMNEIRERVLKNPPNRSGNPAIAESVTLQITLTPDAEPGEHELRLGSPVALSNPLVFCVGQLPELTKPAAKTPIADLAFLRQLKPGSPSGTATNSEMRVTLPATVNGQIMPGATDLFRFAARKGQRLVVTVSGRKLIPYLADAVPGWFQAALTVFDVRGKELAYGDDYRFEPDPLLCFEVPRDADYVIEIKDALFRGREDFVYRMTVGELPFVTDIFPLGGPAFAMSNVELTGWNLSETRLTVDCKEAKPGICWIRPGKTNAARLPFAADTLPECLEHEANDSSATAQRIESPVILNGRIQSPGDVDVFCFRGRAGEEIVAEVHARRLGSPLDSTITLTDNHGRQLAFNDDREDKGSGLNTHHADSWVRTTLPNNGTCYLTLGDTQHHGGPEYAYRLRISSPRPDFELRTVPSSVSVRAGASVPLTVHVLRKDGFTGDVLLSLKDAPAGFALAGARIPAHQDQVRITLTGPPTALPEPVNLVMEGRAIIQSNEVVRLAVPCDDRMQAFAYRHLVPARELKAVVSPRGAPAGRMKIRGDGPVRIPAGGTARVELRQVPDGFTESFQLELNDPPEGIRIEESIATLEGVQVVLGCDAAKLKPGLRGNLIVNLIPMNNPATTGGKPRAGTARRASVGTLPAVPFEIIEVRK